MPVHCVLCRVGRCTVCIGIALERKGLLMATLSFLATAALDDTGGACAAPIDMHYEGVPDFFNERVNGSGRELVSELRK